MTVRPLDIVFMGNPDFAVPSLERLAGSHHNISAVVTGRDKRRGRRGKPEPSPVKSKALDLSLRVIESDDVRTEAFAAQINQLQPDLLVVVAFKLLPPNVLAIPSKGSLNLHASLLPKYRGAAPIHRALINGERETGCTVFLLDEGMDTGAILGLQKTAVDFLETTGDVYDRLKVMGAGLLLRTIDEIAEGKHRPQQQSDKSASKAPKISVEEAEIDFNRDGFAVHNLIRGMSPFPGAWTTCDGKKLKITRSEPAPEIRLQPGQAELISGEAFAGCGNGSVKLTEVRPEGKKVMSGADFLRGAGGSAILGR
ncbi:methionyl-tRNA formyltransferase [Natronogracilivirga saccharolytica]|uniref:Methionyl-tRNA formyltransferase n=1 Tax=Natronogracilivirga saccharolytica TaxID=2812953 RepID=A0A8J7RPA6_9BACT|nr:methionyl-tRNA formyltransferase [Natronogracilivirga saccharolytica]MBP3191369.1 methionyl-tRNA formyltransferase [Natronogracilivirga saccharolytica]